MARLFKFKSEIVECLSENNALQFKEIIKEHLEDKLLKEKAKILSNNQIINEILNSDSLSNIVSNAVGLGAVKVDDDGEAITVVMPFDQSQNFVQFLESDTCVDSYETDSYLMSNPGTGNSLMVD
jgi:hypothetical protein